MTFHIKMKCRKNQNLYSYSNCFNNTFNNTFKNKTYCTSQKSIYESLIPSINPCQNAGDTTKEINANNIPTKPNIIPASANPSPFSNPFDCFILSLDIKPNTIASIEGIIPRPQQQANRNDDIPSTNDAIAKPLVFAYCCSLTLTYALYSLSLLLLELFKRDPHWLHVPAKSSFNLPQFGHNFIN